MAPNKWPTVVPLGKITINNGVAVNLAVNCGPMAGQIQNQGTPNVIAIPGTPFCQLVLTYVGSGVAFLMPRGVDATAHPEQIIMAIPNNTVVYLPNGLSFSGSFLPENYDIDGTASGVVYGCGIING